MEAWYLLYGGESVDGCGRAEYVARTLDKKVALKHFDKINKNPYSTGKVVVVTDSTLYHVFHREDLL